MHLTAVISLIIITLVIFVLETFFRNELLNMIWMNLLFEISTYSRNYFYNYVGILMLYFITSMFAESEFLLTVIITGKREFNFKRVS